MTTPKGLNTRGENVLVPRLTNPDDIAVARDIIDWKFWAANGFTCAIVAVKGGIDDWAAYISGNHDLPEHDTVMFAARYGGKLSRDQATAFFPRMATTFNWRE